MNYPDRRTAEVDNATRVPSHLRPFAAMVKDPPPYYPSSGAKDAQPVERLPKMLRYLQLRGLPTPLQVRELEFQRHDLGVTAVGGREHEDGGGEAGGDKDGGGEGGGEDGKVEAGGGGGAQSRECGRKGGGESGGNDDGEEGGEEGGVSECSHELLDFMLTLAPASSTGDDPVEALTRSGQWHAIHSVYFTVPYYIW